MRITGNLINAYYVCKRQLWLYAHELIPDQESSYLEIGKLIGQDSYQREKKEITVGNMKLDIMKKTNGQTIVAEIKKSSRFELPAYMQLAFYLYRLKEMGINTKGELLIPKEKKRVPVELTDDAEKELRKVSREIESIISQDTPPEPEKNKFCKNCAYREFCWI
jgi:CRISPR-associated exonuclease Cas4